jgi:hypothetical protein
MRAKHEVMSAVSMAFAATAMISFSRQQHGSRLETLLEDFCFLLALQRWMKLSQAASFVARQSFSSSVLRE